MNNDIVILISEDHGKQISVGSRESLFCRFRISAAQSNNQFQYRRTTFSSQFKSRVGNILVKTTTRRINLNIDDTPISVVAWVFQLWEKPMNFMFVYYESIKRDLKIRPIHECWYDERLQTKTKEFTRLTYTGFQELVCM